MTPCGLPPQSSALFFAVFLICMQTGMLLGFVQTTIGLVRNSNADIWIAAVGTTNVDQSGIIRNAAYYRAVATPGVATVSRTVIQFSGWKKSDGSTESVIVVGFDSNSSMARPWNIVEGSLADLEKPNAVMIDRLYAERLGVRAVGDRVEIADRLAVVVGFTEGIRTFTQSPYVFTTYRNALRYTNIEDGAGSYMLVQAKPDTDIAQLTESLSQSLKDFDVMSSAVFEGKTRDYWILTTGAGSALMMGAVLGGLVGIIIVAQTLYSATVERLADYATLTAVGAGSGYLNAIVLKQSLISGIIGFSIAAVIAYYLAAASMSSPAAILLSPFSRWSSSALPRW